MNTFSGTGVAVVTPFDADGHVQIAALRRMLLHLEANVEYLVMLGTTGETSTLSETEQMLILDETFKQLGDRLPIVIGAGGNHTSKVCKQVQTLDKRYPATGFLSVNPYYNKPSQAGLFQHFSAIAGSTDKEIILYNVPGRSASNLQAETTLQLAESCANITAIKEASGDMGQIMEIIRRKPEGFELLSGDDLLALPMVAIGAKGLISVLANAFPEEIGDMIRFALDGKLVQARRIHFEMMPLMQAIFAEGNPVGIKALLKQRGLCELGVRLPLVAASEHLQTQLASLQGMTKQG
ncbi:MAG: 4-hydroxy-tetrahydrodipicolinate synthase [Bacteroidota bacterium]